MQHKVLLSVIVVLSVPFCLVRFGWSRTNDMMQPCVNCHTMHNSQGGGEVVAGALGAQDSLLNSTCYGCHTGANSTSGVWAISRHRPYVYDTAAAPNYFTTGTEPNHTTLAGGSFYWARFDNTSKGHDVAGIVPQTIRTPPGGTKEFNDTTTPLTCAGENGCHGRDLAGASEVKSMYQSHHAADNLQLDGTTLAKSYRFLNGIAGIEDDDWELSVDFTTPDHNQYQGAAADPKSISSLCARCHGDFHSDLGSPSPWFRHPVDYNMTATGEYQDYGLPLGLAGDYVVETPLGSETVADPVMVNNVFSGAGRAVITCITCHRAHGSPNAFSLRWNYQDWPKDSGYNGCGDCHTAKE